MSNYFPVHAHSHYSVMDGMGKVGDMVAKVAAMGQPAFTLSDHGTLAGTVQAYKACAKAGIKFFPACEFYVVQDVHDPDTKETRYHLGIMALDFEGYQALVSLQTLSYREDHFHRKPLIDLSDLAYLYDEGLTEHLALTTGCYSGLVIDQWKGNDPASRAKSMIQTLHAWFPHTFVELQNHGIVWDNGVDDLDIGEALYDIAVELDLPVVIGSDSHYIEPGQQSAHDLMKDICYFGDGEDNHFSGGPYHLHSAQEALALFPKKWRARIEAGHKQLLDLHNVTIPALDKFEFRAPTLVAKDPDKVLWDETVKGLEARGKNTLPYLGRAKDELAVIKAMGMENYHLLVKTHVTDWCRDNGIIVNLRGSGNGSVINYALGISEVDPLIWGTDFDRYLSLDRMKAPDLDIDVDFRGRQRLIANLRAVFPTTVQIANYAQIGMSVDPETGEEKGSVMVQYHAAMGKLHSNYSGQVYPEHRKALEELATTPVYKSMGTHAAGFVLPGDGLPINKYLPLGRIISSNTTVTQYSKDDVEALGYVKLDVLGLRALQTLNGTLNLIGKQANDWDWIPLDDPKACALLRSGYTSGIFQYEGYSSLKGGKEMGIRSTHDVILGLALYRPALMNGGQKDLFLHNRKAKKADRILMHPIFDSIVKDTQGVPIFQEQIMHMLKALGMQFAEYNELMTAIKASNGFIAGAAETFKRLRPLFYDLCEDRGLDADEADFAWNTVIGFTEYGFNRAHATSYGLMSYRAAYLKAHYPLEYMASLLEVWGGEKKEPIYVKEAKRLGLTVVRPCVNESEVSWSIDRGRPNALRKGLVSIPGIGEAVAEAIVQYRPKGGYTSIEHFIETTPNRPVTGGAKWSKGELAGVCRTLMEAGAFRNIYTAP